MAELSLALVDEIEATVRGAAEGSKVVVIRLAVGKDVTVPKMRIASELQQRFPGASIEIDDGKRADAVVVKNIDVE